MDEILNEAAEPVLNENQEVKESAPSPEERATQLERELSELRSEMERKDAENARMLKEYSEFAELFPDVPLNKVNDSVWENVKNGLPLSAAYALYEKKASLQNRAAQLVNEKNSFTSAGNVRGASGDEYYSPEEVKAMSGSEVRANFDKVIASMSHWK